MSFSADWLTLREPFDAAARDEAERGAACDGGGDGGGSLVDAVRGALAAAAAAAADDDDDDEARPEIVDLGTGTGANLRWLAPRLGGAQRWRLLDHDLALLSALPERIAAWSRANDFESRRSDGDMLRVSAAGFDLRMTCERVDLAAAMGGFRAPRGGLVSASALLDLVSEPWLDLLLQACSRAGAALLLALSYDGRIDWQPADPVDAAVLAAVNMHQRRDKGFGPALGPTAAAYAARGLAAHGYRVRSAASDWRIGPDDRAIAAALLDGWTQAAIEAVPARSTDFEQWRQRRMAVLARGALRMTVGHVDLAAWRRLQTAECGRRGSEARMR
ncbi:MAG: hypothetical protein AB7L76_02905 [Burkholderiaceae bacterium]